MRSSPLDPDMLRAATIALALLTALPACAQLRSFPAQALRGELQVQMPPEVQLNGEPARLAPGVRIRGTNNLIVMSASVAGQPLVVNYTRDTYGLVKDIWVLTESERSREPWPRTAEQAATWAFDPVAQTWSKP